MKNATDEWILAMPDGRNDKCPCGCGQKWKKVLLDPESHYETFKSKLEQGEIKR